MAKLEYLASMRKVIGSNPNGSPRLENPHCSPDIRFMFLTFRGPHGRLVYAKCDNFHLRSDNVRQNNHNIVSFLLFNYGLFCVAFHVNIIAR